MKNLTINKRDSIKQQGYQILNLVGQNLADTCAQFNYKGCQVSFSTVGYSRGACLNPVAVFDNSDNLVYQTESVEFAIKWIDETLK